MIEGAKYIAIIKLYFGFLISEFGFELYEEKIQGNAFYAVSFRDEVREISVSYENIADYLLILVQILKNGKLPRYDDKSNTLHLNKLNAALFPKISRDEISLNNDYFLSINAKGVLQRKLLKSAKDLRLCLKHFSRLHK